MSFYEKYIKYKTKYINLKIKFHNDKLVGGDNFFTNTDNNDFINSLGSTPKSTINNQEGGYNMTEFNDDLPDKLTDTPINLEGGDSQIHKKNKKKDSDFESDSDLNSSDILSFSSDSINSNSDEFL